MILKNQEELTEVTGCKVMKKIKHLGVEITVKNNDLYIVAPVVLEWTSSITW